MIVNLGEAQQQLGFKTPYTLRKAVKDGLLDDYLRRGPDKRCVYLELTPPGMPSLRQHVQANTNFNSASPLWRREPVPEPVSDEDWTERAVAFIDNTAWGPPPWTRDQWVTLRFVIELAEDL